MKPGESLLAPSSVNVNPGYFEALHVAARPRPLDRRARHAEVAADRDDRRPAGPEVLAGSGSDRPPAVSSKRSRRHHEDHGEDDVPDDRRGDPGNSDARPAARRDPGRHRVFSRGSRIPAAARRSWSRRAATRPRSSAASGARSRQSIRRCRCSASGRCRSGSIGSSSAAGFRCSSRWPSASSRCCSRPSGCTACSPTASTSAAASWACAWPSAGRQASVFGLVLRDGARVIAAGLALGLIGSYWVGRAVQSQLVDVAPLNPLVFLSVAALLSVVGMTACLIPAWRASRINPVVVLAR